MGMEMQMFINAKNTVGYVTDFANNTYSCPIKPDGTFDPCISTTGFQSSIGLALGFVTVHLKST